jgi:pimeloyl-ACP methyl ester carboxylesterase
MTTFVLVPGAWLGGWAWDAVAARLRADGHEAIPVTLTGLAERAGAGGPGTDLDTHIADIVDVLDENDLRDAVLVAHSYAGVPVTGAADRRPHRVARLVFVDSGPAPDGLAQADFNPPEVREATDRTVADVGDGWRMPPIAFDPMQDPINLAGLDEAALATMRSRATDHPYASTTQPISLTGAVDAIPRTLIACTMPPELVSQMVAAGNPFFAGLKDAQVIPLPTGHWPMFSRPDDLAATLERAAAEPAGGPAEA